MNLGGKRIFAVAAILVTVAVVAWSSFQNDSRCSEIDHVGANACVPSEIILLGNVDVRQVNLAFKVPGRIEKILVEEGDFIKSSQVVALLEQPDFRDDVALSQARYEASGARLRQLENGARPQEIAQAKALVEERRATVENARRTLSRRAELADRGFTAHQAHEDAEAALFEAKARLNSSIEILDLVEAGPREEEVAQARAAHNGDAAALALAQRRLADTELFAPNEGVILTRIREPGAIVAAAETVLNLSLTSPVWVRTYVEEPDLGHVRPGMPAEIMTDSGGSYQGQVGFISPVAEFTPKSVETKALRTSLVYRVRVIVVNSDEGLRQGMPVTVTLKPSGMGSEQPSD